MKKSDYDIIYLIDTDGDKIMENRVWCTDPTPDPNMVLKDAIPYIRLDIARSVIKACIRKPMGVEPDIASEILKTK